MAAKLRGTNIMPGGRVEEIPIETKWVRVAPGSALRQAGTAVADTTKITLSMGIRIDGTPPFGSSAVFEFGGVDVQGDYVYSRIEIRNGGSGTFAVTAALRARDTLTVPVDQELVRSTSLIGATATLAADTDYHLFISADLSIESTRNSGNEGSTLLTGKTGWLYINGVDDVPTENGTYSSRPANTFEGQPGCSAYGPGPVPSMSMAVSGTELAFPTQTVNTALAFAVDYSNIQVWFGQAIDPAGTTFADRSAKNPQASASGRPVSYQQIKELVDGANAYGLDTLVMMTFLNVESAYGTNGNQSGQYRGLFQFNQSEMDTAGAAQGTGTNLNSNQDQLDAYRYYMNGPWGRTVIQRSLIDTTGVYRYLVHNQGVDGFNIIMNAYETTPNAAVSTLSVASNMMGQAWSSPAARGINKSSTVSQWVTALINYFNTKRTEADTRLEDAGSVPNIDFFYKDGLQRIPPVAYVFGAPDILFWGTKDDYIVGSTAINDGTAGDFAVVNMGGITDAP
jgi:hypothetical protein